MKSPDCIVIGAGAAGMMCAITAAEMGKKVLLIEKNKVFGKKLRITGKGRCNVTNDCDADTFFCQRGASSRFFTQCICFFFLLRYDGLF